MTTDHATPPLPDTRSTAPHASNAGKSRTRGPLHRLRILCLLVIIGFYLLVGFAWLWPQDLSSTAAHRVLIDHAAFMLRTFTFHGGVALLITLVFAIILKGRSLALAGLPGVVFAFAPLMSFSANAPTGSQPIPQEPSGEIFTLFSANLLYINADATVLLDQIAARSPDVIVFQEYTNRWDRLLTAALASQYPHVISAPSDDCFGQAVFSKTPFVDEPRLYPPALPAADSATSAYSWNIPQIRATVDFDGRPLVVRNIHLLPPAGMSNVREQRTQTVALATLLKRDTAPYVMAGDFNFTPSSAHHDALIDAGAVSAWQTNGSGRGSTWPRTSWLRHLPGIRLDHVFYSSSLECIATGVEADFGSDHAPVWATFRWPK